MGIPHGYQKELAEAAGISESLMCAILKGRRTCKPKIAEKLVKATKKLLRVETNVFDWQFPGESTNPLFKGVGS